MPRKLDYEELFQRVSILEQENQRLKEIHRNGTGHATGEPSSGNGGPFTKAFSACPDGIVISRAADARIMEVNRSWERIFGYSREEVIGRSSLALDLWENPNERQRAVTQLMEQELADFTAGIRRKSGEVRQISISAERIQINGELCLVSFIRDITERRRAEEALRESEATARVLLNSPSGFAVLVDPNGRILDANDVMAKRFGRSVKELTGSDFRDLLPPEVYARRSSYLKQVVQSARAVSFEDENEGRFFEHILSPVTGPNGEVAKVAVMSWDITGRRRAEEKLLRAREEWENIFHAIGHLTLILDPEHRILAVNKTGERIIGRSTDELIGKRCHEVFHGSSAPPSACPLQRVTKSWGVETSEVEVEALGRIFLISCTPVLDRNGHIEKVIHIATDVTERELAEEALRESEVRYRELTDHSLTGIYLAQEGIIVYLNDRLAKTLGYQPGEMLGRDFHDFVHPDDREMVRTRGVERGKGIPVPPQYEFRCLDKNGKIVWVEVLASTIRYRGKTANMGNLVDITQRKKAEEEKIKLEEQLLHSQKMEAIGTLAGGIAHDFNNLLTIILGNADLMLMELSENHSFHSWMSEVRQAAQRAASLTRQLLAFSRKEVVEPKILCMNDAVVSTQRILARLIGENIRLESCLDPSLRNVEIDTGQLEQVIMNLAVNAKDAMPDGGVLTIRTLNRDLDEFFFLQEGIRERPGSYVMLAMTDTGAGMIKEVLGRIFEPFFTTKERGKGTGLGLATVYGIVKQNRGYVFARSAPGRGATFEVYLPAVEGPAKEVASPETSPERFAGSETVLVVEDEDRLRYVIVSSLARYGYKVLEAPEGESAIRLLEHHQDPVHLLLTDVIMPGMNGRELAEHLKPLRPETRVLYMSGYTDEGIFRYGVLEPGISYIKKPFGHAELARRVREVLDQPW